MRSTSLFANDLYRAGTRQSGDSRSTHGQSVRCVTVSAVSPGITRATADVARVNPRSITAGPPCTIHAPYVVSDARARLQSS